MANKILPQDKATNRRVIVTRDVIVKVQGKRFFCKCGCNVFHEFNDGLLGCNACEIEYE